MHNILSNQPAPANTFWSLSQQIVPPGSVAEAERSTLLSVVPLLEQLSFRMDAVAFSLPVATVTGASSLSVVSDCFHKNSTFRIWSPWSIVAFDVLASSTAPCYTLPSVGSQRQPSAIINQKLKDYKHTCFRTKQLISDQQQYKQRHVFKKSFLFSFLSLLFPFPNKSVSICQHTSVLFTDTQLHLSLLTRATSNRHNINLSGSLEDLSGSPVTFLPFFLRCAEAVLAGVLSLASPLILASGPSLVLSPTWRAQPQRSSCFWSVVPWVQNSELPSPWAEQPAWLLAPKSG